MTDHANIEVSVVIACRNAEPHLAQQLQALAAQRCAAEWELVISDNGSTDRTLTIAERFRPLFRHLTIIDSAARPGPAGARNAAVQIAQGDRIAFCDADDEVAPGWLETMSEALRDHGLVAGRLEHDLLNKNWRTLQRNPQPGLLNTDPPFLPYMAGAALGVQRSVHEQIGGFDESFREAGEDRDYCYRAQLAGVELVFVPQAVVHYRHRRTALAMYRQARGYALGNVRLYRDYRHLGLGRPSAVRALFSWCSLVMRLLPALPTYQRRAVWLARLGWRVGRLSGSIRYRVWAP